MRLPIPDLTRFSLRSRLSAGVVAIVFLTTIGISAAALYFMKRNMQATIAEEHFERISAIADAVDQKFLSRRTLLKTFGDSVESHNFTGADRLQDLVMQHKSLKEAFDNVAFIDAQGEIVANMNGAQQIGKINVKDRDYFQKTVAGKAGMISQPFKNRISGLAQVAMTEPVLDREGKIAYLIVAFITLSEHNFLGELANVKFGKSGYMFIVNTSGIIVDHPDRSRLLQHIDADGIRNAAADRAIAGFEGAAEGVNRRGVHALYAFKHIRQTNWVLGAMYPRQEAFAKAEQIERFAWAGALLLTLLAGGLTFMNVRSQLAPLSRLREHMQVSRANSAYTPLEDEPARDEVGDLSQTFDTLMRERRAAQERVKSSERFLRDVTDNLPAVVAYFDSNQRCLFANKAGLRMQGRTQADIGRMTMRESLPDAVYRQLAPQVAKALQGTPTRTEGTYDRKGKEGFFECHLLPDVRDDGVVGYYVMTFDITERKQAEMRSADSERRLRGLTDNVPALLTELDLDERVVFCNGRYLAWLGIEPASMMNRHIRETMGEAHYEVRKPLLARAFAGEVVSFEQTAQLLIGERTLQTTYLPHRDAEGSVVGLYVLCARRHRPEAEAEAAGCPCAGGCAHGLAEPPFVRRACTRGHGQVAALGKAGVPAVPGHRLLQVDQRFAGPRGRRRGAQGVRPPAQGKRARNRHAGALRRRRVRDPSRGSQWTCRGWDRRGEGACRNAAGVPPLQPHPAGDRQHRRRNRGGRRGSAVLVHARRRGPLRGQERGKEPFHDGGAADQGFGQRAMVPPGTFQRLTPPRLARPGAIWSLSYAKSTCCCPKLAAPAALAATRFGRCNPGVRHQPQEKREPACRCTDARPLEEEEQWQITAVGVHL